MSGHLITMVADNASAHHPPIVEAENFRCPDIKHCWQPVMHPVMAKHQPIPSRIKQESSRHPPRAQPSNRRKACSISNFGTVPNLWTCGACDFTARGPVALGDTEALLLLA